MPTATYDELADLNAMWVDPEAAEPEGFQQLPEGDYIVRVDRCAFERSKEFKRMLKWEFTVVAGNLNGKTSSRINMLETAQNIGFLKKDLRLAGIGIDEPNFDIAQFIAAGTSVLIDKLLKITIAKSKSDTTKTNTYINGTATDADVVAVNNGAPVGATAPAGVPNAQPAAETAPNPWAG